MVEGNEDVPSITELALLFREITGNFGEIDHGECRAYEEAFEAYLHGHPHLKELYIDEGFRRKKLATQVRAMARKVCLEER